MATVSALILTHNSQDLLPDCLASLAWADEIVVVDDDSTDATREIAGQHQARIVSRKLETFSAQRNAGLAVCTGDWVLVVDADERISDALAAEIKAVLAGETRYNGYRMPRKNFFLDQWVRHGGWYPDYCLRLYRRGDATYHGRVHEGIDIPPPIGTLQGPLLHLTYQSIEQYVAKMNHYTTLAAQEMRAAGKQTRPVQFVLKPCAQFVKSYLLRGGYRDGRAGLALSMLSSTYALLKLIKLAFHRKD